MFCLSFSESESGGESDRRADNGNCNLHRRLVHNQITIVNRLEPHSVGLVIQYLVDISAVGPVGQVVNDHISRYCNLLVTVVGHITVVSAVGKVVRTVVDVEGACMAVNVAVIDGAWSHGARCEMVGTRFVLLIAGSFSPRLRAALRLPSETDV